MEFNYSLLKIIREKELIGNDKDWGDIKDFWMYSGNIYLLDSGKDEIYKYLVAENGYSNKSSYFGSGQSINLGGAQKFSIDGFVDIALDGAIAKYVSGVKEQFSLDLPEDDIQFDMIFTSKGLMIYMQLIVKVNVFSLFQKRESLKNRYRLLLLKMPMILLLP